MDVDTTSRAAKSNLGLYFGSINVNNDALSKIEKNLRPYERISLYFLIYDTDDALKAVERTISAGDVLNNGSLCEWMDGRPQYAKETLIEALLIIKTYREVDDLLIDKKYIDLDRLKEHFLPDDSTVSLFVHPVKKILFHVCEEFDKADTRKFIDWVANRKLIERSEDPNHLRYLELLMLRLIERGVIELGSRLNQQTCNVSVICEYLDSIHLSKFSQALNNVMNDTNFSRMRVETRTDELYIVDKQKNMGYFLIFNQEEFVSTDRTLDPREGSSCDVDRLYSVWKGLGFRVFIFPNLNGGDILNKIDEFAGKQRSVFGVCILSHGFNDGIYGRDGTLIDVKLIKSQMDSESLLGRPKILLIQACRGNAEMTLIEPSVVKKDCSDIVTDNPSAVAPMSDFIIFWATVSDHVSYRHTKKGSFFIQTLCECIEANKHQEIYEIFIKVNRKVSQIPVDKCNCQISEFHVTLTKKLYLQPTPST